MNAVVIAVIIMLALSLSRVHVVLSLAVGAFVGRVGDILQRHTGHQAADKRADSQAEHHMHAR